MHASTVTVYCQELFYWSQTDLPEIILYPLINGWQQMFRLCVGECVAAMGGF